LMVAVLALVLDLILAIAQKAAVPHGLGSKKTTSKNQDAGHLQVQDKELT